MKPVFRKGLHVILLTIAAGNAVTTVADATYYRWIDSRGNPIHSDRPPAKGIDYEVVSTKSTFSRSVSAEEGAVPAEVEPSVGNEFDPEDSAEGERSEKNSELCSRARANLETLSASDTVHIRNSEGEVEQLSSKEVKIQREIAQSKIKIHCDDEKGS